MFVNADLAGLPSRGFVGAKAGWGGRIRTSECQDQNLVPYHLATPHQKIYIKLILLEVFVLRHFWIDFNITHIHVLGNNRVFNELARFNI